MAKYEVPLSPEAQTFEISMAGATYRLTVQWRETEQGGWFLDIATADGAALLNGKPLVTGADLLAQHPHLGFGGRLVVETDGDLDAVPTFENLGLSGRLYFITD